MADEQNPKPLFSDWGILIPAGNLRDGVSYKIPPIEKHIGPGTYETFFDMDKYAGHKEASAAKDYVVADYLTEDNTRYVTLYHIKQPDKVTKYLIQRQHAPFGMDIADHHAIEQIAVKLFQAITDHG